MADMIARISNATKISTKVKPALRFCDRVDGRVMVSSVGQRVGSAPGQWAHPVDSGPVGFRHPADCCRAGLSWGRPGATR